MSSQPVWMSNLLAAFQTLTWQGCGRREKKRPDLHNWLNSLAKENSRFNLLFFFFFFFENTGRIIYFAEVKWASYYWSQGSCLQETHVHWPLHLMWSAASKTTRLFRVFFIFFTWRSGGLLTSLGSWIAQIFNPEMTLIYLVNRGFQTAWKCYWTPQPISFFHVTLVDGMLFHHPLDLARAPLNTAVCSG